MIVYEGILEGKARRGRKEKLKMKIVVDIKSGRQREDINKNHGIWNVEDK